MPVIQPMQAPSMAMPANAPPIGLIGSEQALQQGLAGALAGLSEGIGQGQADIRSNLRGALGQLSRGRSAAQGAYGQGVSALNPYSQVGQQGQNLQAALAGLQGQEAFNQALMDSPATRFLQEQGERAALRTAAARGGLGGGNVMKELARFNTGLAAQDLQNQYARAQGLAQQGLQAAGQIGQLRGMEGSALAGLAQAGAGLQSQAGSQLGNLGLQGGMFAGQAALGTGQNLAAGRTRAAEQIAGQVGGTTSALAQLLNQQGAGISDITGQAGGNLANLLSGAGQAQATSNEQLAALLANINQGTAAQVASQPMLNLPISNTLGQVGQLSSGIGSMINALNEGKKDGG
jgi:hypothetical protein